MAARRSDIQGHPQLCSKFEANLGYRRPYLKNTSEIERKGREIGPEVGGMELEGDVRKVGRTWGTYVAFDPDGWRMDRTCQGTAEVSGLLLVSGPLTME